MRQVWVRAVCLSASTGSWVTYCGAHPEQAVLDSLMEHSLGNVPVQYKPTSLGWTEQAFPSCAPDVGLPSLHTDEGLAFSSS